MRNRFGKVLVLLLLCGGSTADAHNDPAGCFQTSAVVIVNVFRADGTTGVVGTISECETILYQARLAKAADISTLCAFSGGPFTLTTPNGVVHTIEADVPCIGGDGLGEGCDATRDFIDSALIPYTVSRLDVTSGFILASASYAGGVTHDAGVNSPGLVASSAKSTPVVFCGDNNPCTDDLCDPGAESSAACSFPPIVCNDNNACTIDQCLDGICVFSSEGLVCNDNDLCTSDGGCNPITGQCDFSPIVCNDNDLCTTDSCNPAVGCVFTPSVTCNDNDGCTLDSCNPATGQCINTPASFAGCASCGDGVKSGTEQCDLGVANGSPTACCTSGCELRPATYVCRSAVGECDAPDTCTDQTGQCPADEKRSSGTACADDGIVCTADRCDGNGDACTHAPGNAGTQCRPSFGPCDQADVCDGLSAACPTTYRASGACPDDAKDGNLCTVDQCTGNSIGCHHDVMDDGDVCRGDSSGTGCDVPELCKNGVCPPDKLAQDRTPCSPAGSDENPCIFNLCNGSGKCIPFTFPRFTQCATSSFCDGDVCRPVPVPTCGLKPGVDDGEQCDDGLDPALGNDTPASCCTFDCKFKEFGRECSTESVTDGRCNGGGVCRPRGECGNGATEEVASLNGKFIQEECDRGVENGKGPGGRSCCTAECKLRDLGFPCGSSDTVCDQAATCLGNSGPGDTGECPANSPAEMDKPCADGNACTVEDHCSGDGKCVSTNICQATDVTTAIRLSSLGKGKLTARLSADVIKANASVLLVGSATSAAITAGGGQIPTECAPDLLDAQLMKYQLCKSKKKQLKEAGSPVKQKCKATPCLKALLKKNKSLKSFSLDLQANYTAIGTGQEGNGDGTLAIPPVAVEPLTAQKIASSPTSGTGPVRIP